MKFTDALITSNLNKIYQVVRKYRKNEPDTQGYKIIEKYNNFFKTKEYLALKKHYFSNQDIINFKVTE